MPIATQIGTMGGCTLCIPPLPDILPMMINKTRGKDVENQKFPILARIHTIHHNAGYLRYLRILLHHIGGAKAFKYLNHITVEHMIHMKKCFRHVVCLMMAAR